MNYKLLIAGIVGTFILSFCLVSLFAIGVMGKQFFSPEKKSQRIQVAPVAPLTTPVYATRQQVVSAPPGLIAASLEETTAAKTPTRYRASAFVFTCPPLELESSQQHPSQ